MSLYLTYPQSADESRPTTGTFKCWNCHKQHPVEDRKDYFPHSVCSKCDLHLFDEAEKWEKRR